MPIRIHFPIVGSARIEPQSRPMLQEIARLAQGSHVRRVRVEGHTCACGPELGAWAHGTERANVVAHELVRLGVPRERLEAVSYSQHQPLVEETVTERDGVLWSENSRVEFTFLLCR
jgi:OOP family OmpA-OmpF porin